MSLAGKVAIITGSSSGIGASTAILLAKKGCKVTVTGRNAENLAKIVKQCEAEGAKVLSIIGEITDSKHLKRLVEETEKEHGPIDILVNNAGGACGYNAMSLMDCEIEAFDKIMTLNLRSLIELTKLSVPSLKKTQGCVVNISSTASSKANPRFFYYGLAKTGVDYATKCIANELAPFKVRVNCINPGGTRTAILLAHMPPGSTKEDMNKMWDSMAAHHPLGRISEPEEIAAAVVYLASPDAINITGISLKIDGGLHSSVPSALANVLQDSHSK